MSPCWVLHRSCVDLCILGGKKVKRLTGCYLRTLAFAAAAESAFSGLGQQLKKATSLEVTGQRLPKIPRQWLNTHLQRISLKECDLDNLPIRMGNSVPQLEQLFLDHNRCGHGILVWSGCGWCGQMTWRDVKA